MASRGYALYPKRGALLNHDCIPNCCTLFDEEATLFVRAIAPIKEGDELTIAVDLGLGKHASRLFTCDLTYDYVKINAEYTT